MVMRDLSNSLRIILHPHHMVILLILYSLSKTMTQFMISANQSQFKPKVRLLHHFTNKILRCSLANMCWCIRIHSKYLYYKGHIVCTTDTLHRTDSTVKSNTGTPTTLVFTLIINSAVSANVKYCFALKQMHKITLKPQQQHLALWVLIKPFHTPFTNTTILT